MDEGNEGGESNLKEDEQLEIQVEKDIEIDSSEEQEDTKYSFMCLSQVLKIKRSIKKNKKIVFDISDTIYRVVKSQGQNSMGWTLLSGQCAREDWNIAWYDTYISEEFLRRMLPYQKINHFPGSFQLGKKNYLAQNLSRMRKIDEEQYSFFPRTWNLPLQFEEFKRHNENSKTKKKPYYIVKPESSCQGRGIYLTKKVDGFTYSDQCVIQEYIKNPFLIDGLKFDFRIYVLIKSVCPLKIFMYPEGLTRFATVKYAKPNKKNCGNFTMHLTNYAVNKKNPNFVFNQDDLKDGVGHKRSFSSVLKELHKLGQNVDKLYLEIKQAIVKTIISAYPQLAHTYRSSQPREYQNEMCFEILGFDVMIDEKCKPWLLEVNHSASFHCDSPLDSSIKKNVILDTLNILHVSSKEKKTYLDHKAQSQLTQKKREPNETAIIDQTKIINYENKHKGAYMRIFPPDVSQDNTDYNKLLNLAVQAWKDAIISKKQLLQQQQLSGSSNTVLGNLPGYPIINGAPMILQAGQQRNKSLGSKRIPTQTSGSNNKNDNSNNANFSNRNNLNSSCPVDGLYQECKVVTIEQVGSAKQKRKYSKDETDSTASGAGFLPSLSKTGSLENLGAVQNPEDRNETNDVPSIYELNFDNDDEYVPEECRQLDEQRGRSQEQGQEGREQDERVYFEDNSMFKNDQGQFLSQSDGKQNNSRNTIEMRNKKKEAITTTPTIILSNTIEKKRSRTQIDNVNSHLKNQALVFSEQSLSRSVIYKQQQIQAAQEQLCQLHFHQQQQQQYLYSTQQQGIAGLFPKVIPSPTPLKVESPFQIIQNLNVHSSLGTTSKYNNFQIKNSVNQGAFSNISAVLCENIFTDDATISPKKVFLSGLTNQGDELSQNQQPEVPKKINVVNLGINLRTDVISNDPQYWQTQKPLYLRISARKLQKNYLRPLPKQFQRLTIRDKRNDQGQFEEQQQPQQQQYQQQIQDPRSSVNTRKINLNSIVSQENKCTSLETTTTVGNTTLLGGGEVNNQDINNNIIVITKQPKNPNQIMQLKPTNKLDFLQPTISNPTSSGVTAGTFQRLNLSHLTGSVNNSQLLNGSLLLPIQNNPLVNPSKDIAGIVLGGKKRQVGKSADRKQLKNMIMCESFLDSVRSETIHNSISLAGVQCNARNKTNNEQSSDKKNLIQIVSPQDVNGNVQGIGDSLLGNIDPTIMSNTCSPQKLQQQQQIQISRPKVNSLQSSVHLKPSQKIAGSVQNIQNDGVAYPSPCFWLPSKGRASHSLQPPSQIISYK